LGVFQVAKRKRPSGKINQALIREGPPKTVIFAQNLQKIYLFLAPQKHFFSDFF